ncbi:hypothetical protein ACFVH0_27545 [Streptomyces sp. NPDC127117]|uniref:hypothetical protein n=1 Tax=Streptomyces sp. NPDC127117 TaxID=3345368 RepID=UPI00363D6505
MRFTQAGGAFDHVAIKNAPSAGGWRSDVVGAMSQTDWEKCHREFGAMERNGTITVTGTGDIGPGGTEGAGRPVGRTLGGLVLGLLVVLVVAVRFVASEYRRGSEPQRGTPVTRRVPAAKAVVVGAVTFVTVLLAVGVVITVGVAVLKGNGTAVVGVSAPTGVRVVVGTAAVPALSSVLAVALGALLRRAWLVIPVAVLAFVVPYTVTSLPLPADGLSQWLLRLTPAAAFAAQQTLIEYPQVVAHYAPSTGYVPLPWWAGIAVLCGYVVVLLGLALSRLPRGAEPTGPRRHGR